MIVLIGLILSVINTNAQKYGKEEKELNLAEAANNYLGTSAVLENRILQVVSYFSVNEDKIPLSDRSLTNLKTSTITVTPITFGQVAEVETWLKTDTNCKEIQKGEFKGGATTYTVKHSHTSYDLSFNVIAKSGNQLQVIEIDNDGNIKFSFTK